VNFSLKTQKNIILVVFTLFLFGMWGSYFLPNSLLSPVLFLNLTDVKPFIVKEVYSDRPRVEWQIFITVRYPGTEKTYVFFEDEPLPFIFPENGIRKEKVEEIVKSISKDEVYGTYLLHRGSVLYWRVFIGHTRDYYDINITTGEVEGRGRE